VSFGSPLVGDAPLRSNFTGAGFGGVGGLAYSWDFGDGSTTSTQDPTHTFVVPGLYTVVLNVTDSTGRTVSSSVEVTVDPSLAASITAATSVEFGTPIDLAAIATGGEAPYAYAWSFGDGSVATGANPSHIYTIDGTYTATVVVMDATGGQVTALHSVVVVGSPPASPPPSTQAGPTYDATAAVVAGEIVAGAIAVALIVTVVLRRGR
jgi:PKD repeat protein